MTVKGYGVTDKHGSLLQMITALFFFIHSCFFPAKKITRI